MSEIHRPTGEVVVYEAPDGEVRVEVLVGDETVWLSQAQMAELFETSTDNVGLHIKNVYAEEELEEAATAEESSVVRSPVASRDSRIRHWSRPACSSRRAKPRTRTS